MSSLTILSAGLMIAIGMVVLPGTAATPRPLFELVNSSDAIVIADINAVAVNGTQRDATFTVVRVLKGVLTIGAVTRAHYTPVGKAQREITAVPRQRGMLFLREESPGVWELKDADGAGLGVSARYFAVTHDGPAGTLFRPGASVIDKVILELAAEVEEKGGKPQYVEQLKVSGSDSATVLEIYQRWAQSSSESLRVVGLARLASTGDVQAFIRLASEHAVLTGSPLGIYVSGTLSSLRKPQPDAVRALVVLATSSSLRPEIQSAARRALYEIHSREALPAFYALLSSPDAITRELAVSGFSSFVTNKRISEGGLDADEAMDEVMNPGRKRTLPSPNAPYDTPETRKYLHFGPFQNAAEEATYIAFWKSWYERNRAQLGL